MLLHVVSLAALAQASPASGPEHIGRTGRLVHRHGVCCSRTGAECRVLGFNPGRQLAPLSPGAPPVTAVNCTWWAQKPWGHQSRSAVAVAAPAEPAVGAHLYITGCARNLGDVIARTTSHVESLGSRYAGYGVVVFEDGSTDNTRTHLQQWAERNPRVGLIFARGVKAAGSRTMRLALARNTLLRVTLAVAQTAPASAGAPIMLMLDLDCPHGDALKPAALDGALASMLQPSASASARGGRLGRGGRHPGGASRAEEDPPVRYSVLLGNSLPHYYDVWTVRSKALLLDYDCFLGECTCPYETLEPCCEAGRAEVARRGHCFQYEVSIDPSGPIFPVEAGFNGLALYNLADVYAGERGANCSFRGDRHCEHVHFQTCLGSHGLRVGIDPSLVQGCGADHMHALSPKLYRAHVAADGSITYPPPTLRSRVFSAFEGATGVRFARA